MSYSIKHFALSTLFVIAISCLEQKNSNRNSAHHVTIQQYDLAPAYAISLPDNYKIISGQGVDFTDHYFVPVDTTDHRSPTATIIFGHNVGCWEPDIEKNIKRDTFPSLILDNHINWIGYKKDSAYIAEAFLEGKFCASIRVLQKNQVDSFISIFKTLKHK